MPPRRNWPARPPRNGSTATSSAASAPSAQCGGIAAAAGNPVARIDQIALSWTVTIERTNPAGLHPTPGYHHVTKVHADTLIYLAGQCPLDPAGSLADGGLAGQTAQVIENIRAALAAAGAGPDDVVRTVIYVNSSDRNELAAVWVQLNESPLAPAFKSASTLLGVAQLGFPGQLVEIDVTAAL